MMDPDFNERSYIAQADDLRADLKTVAVLLERIQSTSSPRSAGWAVDDNRKEIEEALARPGVKAVLP